MARLSDLIEEFIKNMLNAKDESILEIQRNELTIFFSCAPSQINYVLATRFTADKGYFVESRRGGGGCIKITKIEYESNEVLFRVLSEKIGDKITYDSAKKIINSLFDGSFLLQNEANLMKAATNDRALALVLENRNEVRAEIFKVMLLTTLFK